MLAARSHARFGEDSTWPCSTRHFSCRACSIAVPASRPMRRSSTATADGVRRQTYRETRDRAHQLAHALKAAGIGVGDRVGTFMWNGARHLEAYHAIAGMGAVLHTLNIRLSDQRLGVHHRATRRIKLIIVDADLLPLLEKLHGRMPSVERVVVATEARLRGLETRTLPQPSRLRRFHRRQAHAATIGPRLMRTHRWACATRVALPAIPRALSTNIAPNIIHTHGAMLDRLHETCRPPTAFCGIVPMFHAMGWGLPWSALMLGMQAGHAASLHGHRNGCSHLLVSREQVTMSAGVPTIWQGIKGLLRGKPRGPVRLCRTCQRLTCGGSAPPPIVDSAGTGTTLGRGDDPGLGHDRDLAVGYACQGA